LLQRVAWCGAFIQLVGHGFSEGAGVALQLPEGRDFYRKT
jgi:hypothetical protein